MEQKQLNSPFEQLDIPQNATVPEILLSHAESEIRNGRSEHRWIVDCTTDFGFAYKDFKKLTGKVASAFNRRGMQKGDIVIYMTNQMIKLHVFATGVWRANGIVRSSYPEDTEETILWRVRESRAKWILCDVPEAPVCMRVAQKVTDWKVEVILTSQSELSGCSTLDEFFNDDGQAIPEVKIKPEDPAAILCTSGTTGLSKGAVHTHQSVLALMYLSGSVPWTKEKPNLLMNKATHISGLIRPMALFVSGKTAIVMPKITYENAMRAIEKYKPGCVFGFPTFLLMLASKTNSVDMSSLEVVITGGAIISPAMVNEFYSLPSLRHLVIVYGMTEITFACSTCDYSDNNRGTFTNVPAFSFGKPLPGISVQILDMDTLEPLGPNQRGELCLRGPAMMHSYFNNPEETKNAFVDGWIRSGDIGYYDENGFVFVVDRLKEIFKYYNNHISPCEIESVISADPAVHEVCVIGHPDPGGYGHVPRGFVTLKPSIVIDECINDKFSYCSIAKSIAKAVESNLANYKQLRAGLFILENMPKGKTGKITRSIMENLTEKDALHVFSNTYD